jgi:hypothetical protein
MNPISSPAKVSLPIGLQDHFSELKDPRIKKKIKHNLIDIAFREDESRIRKGDSAANFSVIRHIALNSQNLFRVIIMMGLGAIVILLVLRPYLLILPFRASKTVKVGSFLGKIEATTMVHTRLKTFDGKTVFIPNKMILSSIITIRQPGELRSTYRSDTSKIFLRQNG